MHLNQCNDVNCYLHYLVYKLYQNSPCIAIFKEVRIAEGLEAQPLAQRVGGSIHQYGQK